MRRNEWSPSPECAARDQVLIEEVKIACTLALLTCLSRPLRVAYILGDIFELSDAEAAHALKIDPAAFRQRLRRARALVTGFVQARRPYADARDALHKPLDSAARRKADCPWRHSLVGAQRGADPREHCEAGARSGGRRLDALQPGFRDGHRPPGGAFGGEKKRPADCAETTRYPFWRSSWPGR